MSSDVFASLRNLGPKSSKMLQAAGITTPQQIEKLGSVPTYLRVKNVLPNTGLNLLWALEANLLGIDWRELTDLQKSHLKNQLRELQ